MYRQYLNHTYIIYCIKGQTCYKVRSSSCILTDCRHIFLLKWWWRSSTTEINEICSNVKKNGNWIGQKEGEQIAWRTDRISFQNTTVMCCRDFTSVCWKMSVDMTVTFQMIVMAPTVGTGAISVAFVRPSVRLSVCPSVAYIANNSRTQRPSVPKFGRKVPHLCDSHTSFKVKRSKVRVRGGRGHTVSAEPGGHTAYFYHFNVNIIL